MAGKHFVQLRGKIRWEFCRIVPERTGACVRVGFWRSVECSTDVHLSTTQPAPLLLLILWVSWHRLVNQPVGLGL